MMIILSTTHLHDIRQHAENMYPHECCGAMLGTLNQETQHKITKVVIPIDNQSEKNQRRRFAISAEDYKFIEDEATRRKLTLLGFYHSHPDHPAEPSDTDLAYAWPFFSYIIQAVDQGTANQMGSFVLDSSTGKMLREELQIR